MTYCDLSSFNTNFLGGLKSSLTSMLVATSHVLYDVINKLYLVSFGHLSRQKMPNFSLSHWTILFSSIFLLSLPVLHSSFLVHLSLRLKCTFVITRCPSSVVRPSFLNFSHFRLLLWNLWTEFNKTWQEARTQHPLPSLSFSGWSEKQDGHPGLWLAETFSTSPLKPANGIQRNLTGSNISMSSTKFVFFGPIGKTRWPSWPLIGWDIFDFSEETAELNSTKLDRKQDLNVLYQVCIFLADRKNKMAALASD